MVKRIKIVIIIALLFNKQFCIAQAPSLGEITAKADKLIGDYKDKQALVLLENINIEDYSNENNTELASYYFVKAVAYDLNEDTYNSINAFQKACDYYEEAGITYDRYLQSLQSIGRIYYKLGDIELSQKYFKKIILYGTPSQLFKNAELNDLDFVSNAFYNLGVIYADKEEIEMAIKCLPKIIQQQKPSQIKSQHILYEYIINKLTSKSLELTKEEKFDAAITVMNNLLALIESYEGRLNDKFIRVSFDKGLVLGYNQGLYKEAIEVFRLIVGLKDLIDEPNKDICSSFCFLTMYLSALKDYDKVQEILSNGYNYLKNAEFTDYPPHMLYRFAGNGAYGNNDYSQAIAYYKKYLDSNNPKEGTKNYEEIVNMLSVSYIRSGDPDKSQKLLDAFLKDNEKTMITNNPNILADMYHNLGRSLMLKAEYVDALTYLNKSKDLQIKLYGDCNSRTNEFIKECVNKK